MLTPVKITRDRYDGAAINRYADQVFRPVKGIGMDKVNDAFPEQF
jgi:hypothetical protein